VFSEALKTRTENRKKEKEKKGVLKDFQLDHRKQKTTNRKNDFTRIKNVFTK